ncbi:hypothetical protein PIB30_076624 [Stylosanthes scabra]|uniref:Uncharacterized protein n=1 Tax=Stylosanthes scabra TaxID=79078 RepID=A0ABU6VTR8_9FABA|nr:hypothetical protein [Stylosanthes scabra]
MVEGLGLGGGGEVVGLTATWLAPLVSNLVRKMERGCWRCLGDMVVYYVEVGNAGFGNLGLIGGVRLALLRWLLRLIGVPSVLLVI